MGLKIFVDRSVLIPRPETEEMVEKAIDILKDKGKRLKVLDIGTGSGAIAVALAKNIDDISVIGIDLSPAAVKIAEKNAKYNKVSNRCTFKLGNLFNPIDTKADLIISNPPYIPGGEIDKLMREVRDWEPRSALNGGKDGLTYIKKIIKSAPKYLKNEGILMLEFGVNQSEAIKNEAKKYFMSVEIIKDLSGKDRFLIAG